MTNTVVYIDDEEDLCDVFALRFERHGAKIECFSKPEEGVAFINENDISVVFSDFRMPGMNGIEVLKAIDKEIPFYIITGEIMAEEVAEQSNGLLRGVIKKPYRPKEIDDIISQAIEAKSAG